MPSRSRPEMAQDARVPESHLDILEKRSFAHVATVGSDGAPQVSVVWFDWDGTRLSFSTIRGRQKFRNLERDPRIAMTITDPDDPYRYVELRGRVSIEDDPDA